MVSEQSLTKRIMRTLNSIEGVKAIKFHGSVYGEAGTPDIIGCVDGRMFLIEVKAGKNALSPIQERRLIEWAVAGAPSRVAREDFDVKAFVLSVINA